MGRISAFPEMHEMETCFSKYSDSRETITAGAKTTLAGAGTRFFTVGGGRGTTSELVVTGEGEARI